LSVSFGREPLRAMLVIACGQSVGIVWSAGVGIASCVVK
jgi:hypothetical protein